MYLHTHWPRYLFDGGFVTTVRMLQIGKSVYILSVPPPHFFCVCRRPWRREFWASFKSRLRPIHFCGVCSDIQMQFIALFSNLATSLWDSSCCCLQYRESFHWLYIYIYWNYYFLNFCACRLCSVSHPQSSSRNCFYGKFWQNKTLWNRCLIFKITVT